MDAVLKYAIIGVFSIIIVIAGYKMISGINERACKTEIAKFEVELKNIDKSLRFGAKELQSYSVPCKVDKIYFFDLNKKIDPKIFKDIPIIKDALESGTDHNIFLVNEDGVKHSFNGGNIQMAYPYHICFTPKFDTISFFIEGAGKSAKITSACNQPECTFMPVNISKDSAREIIKEAVEFGCGNCPNDADKEEEKIEPTRQNVEIFRKFSFCEGQTSIQIVIKPKKGSDVRDFRFYEFIPKTCINDLNSYLIEKTEGDVDVKGEPLILWYFSDLGDEKRVSYKLSTALDDECRQAIQGLGVAHFVG